MILVYICEVKTSVIISFVFLFVAFTSCKKQREKSIQASKDYALYQTDLSTVLPLVILCTKNKTYFNQVLFNQADTLNTCASFNLISGDTASILNGPITFKINFNNCQDKDNFTKNGDINVTLYNYSDNVGGNILLSFSDFKIGNSTLKGSISITRFALNSYRIATSNFTNTNDGKKIIYDAFITYLLEPNADVNYLFDDNLSVNDKDVFVNRLGSEYQVLNKELFRSMSCSYFNRGKVEIVDGKNTTQVLDFGNGTCDGVATVFYDENEFSFTIK